MRIYSVFENEQCIGDMTADDISQMLKCSRQEVLNAVSSARLINEKYAVVYDGDNTVTGTTPLDRKLLKEFVLITNQLKGMMGV